MSDRYARILALMFKEFIQMRRDKATLGMMVGIPLMQLILFGFAINLNPQHLPAAIVSQDESVFTRRILTSLEQSTYFHFVAPPMSEEKARDLLRRSKVQFVVNIPPRFSYDLVRGNRPQLLLEVDATDPASATRAMSVFSSLPDFVFKQEAVGALAYLQDVPPVYTPLVLAKYNPLAITALNIVPGLLGVVLTMTLVLITALAITREYERGTMENLLATPLQPIEVMIGKLVPYIVVGYVQVLLILACAASIFHVPMEGSILLLLILCLPFIAANLAVGLTFSTLASNQLQAVQGGMFFFLPSILLSGFMFPFHGMPEWAQWIGNCLPLTHFLLIVRGILLKGSHFTEVWSEVVPILIFTLLALYIASKRYRQTLD